MPLATQLVRAAFNGVEFPCAEVRDSVQNESKAHTAWRVPGADVEHTGRGPLKTTLRVMFLNGLTGSWPADMFPGRHDEVLEEFIHRRDGTLMHPYRGPMQAHFDSFEVTFDPGTQQGVFVDLGFTETNASADLPVRQADQEPGSALVSSAEAADALVAPIVPDAKPIAPVVDKQLAYLESDDRSSEEALGAVAEILAVVRAAAALPALATTAGYPARVALREVERSAWAYRTRYLTPKPQTRQHLTTAPMSLARIAALVYRDASKAHLLRRANVIPCELRVPAGTALKVPDDA